LLSAKKVQRVKVRGRYYDTGNGGVRGFCLQVSANGAKSWLLRYQLDGKKRWLGLGSFPTFSLSEARERARRERQRLADGVDPLLVRRKERSTLKAAAAKTITFKEAAEQFHRLHAHEWKNTKHAAQVINTLRQYAFPHLGDMNVAEITTSDILKVIEPIWISKTETASRVRGRIEQVLGWSQVRGYRTGDNPARWRGHLDQALPKRSKVAPVEHHPALPYAQVPEFMADLRRREGTAAQALRLTVLTAARSDETISARWEEIDFDEAMWRIPAGRMKGSKAHNVPLAPTVTALLRSLYREEGNPYVFLGAKRSASLSNMAMTNVIRRMNEDRSKQGLPRYVDPQQGNRDISVHGMRAAFRDWCSEQTNFPREVCEMALAHAIDSKVEAAYRRGELLKKRRQLAESWARYCFSPPVQKADRTVVPLRLA
jgi:integrase